MAMSVVALAVAAGGVAIGGQSAAVQRALKDAREFVLDFDVTQGNDCGGSASSDQITIVFSNQSGDVRTAPMPVLGEDVLQEFSFSARDITSGRLRFRRRVRDRSFLDARFIRIVNLGAGAWCSGQLSLSVDNVAVLDRVALTPRKGQATAGLQNWNRANWSGRTYWEASLPPLLRRSASDH
jgi:hypothetical protein